MENIVNTSPFGIYTTLSIKIQGGPVRKLPSEKTRQNAPSVPNLKLRIEGKVAFRFVLYFRRYFFIYGFEVILFLHSNGLRQVTLFDQAVGELTRDSTRRSIEMIEVFTSIKKKVTVSRSYPPPSNLWKKRNERLRVEAVSYRSTNGTRSRKECVINGHTTKAKNN